MNTLPLKIALRYLLAKKSHSAVNIITIISTVAVIVATIAIVCVLSVFNGFSGLVHDKLSKIDAEIEITPRLGKTINNLDSIINVIESVDGITAIVPTIQEQALAMYGDYQRPIMIKGVADGYEQVTDIESLVKGDGAFQLYSDDIQLAIISVGVAISLGAHPNYSRMLYLYAPRRGGRVNMANPISSFRVDSLFVSGVFQSGDNIMDEGYIITSFKLAEGLLEYQNQATSIELATEKNSDETAIIKQIEQQLGADYIVKDRLQQQQASFQMINIEKWITFALLAFILIIATFNVISTMSVLIIEKGDSISSLKNLGASRKQINQIFIIEGWLISILGAFIGIIIGVTLSLIQQYYGVIKLAGDPSQLIVDHYPVIVSFSDVTVISVLIIAIGAITSIATSIIVNSRFNR
ncbi:MAG: FtsX-like permease family protein [Bacteroidales bacterium]